MPEYKKLTGPEMSERAPRGVCEIAVQAITHRAFNIQSEFQTLLEDHLDTHYETEAYELEGGSGTARLVIYTGTDRLGAGELRDIGELYGMATGYDRGNIPPNMSVYAARNEADLDRVRVWLEFKLSGEMPRDDVVDALRDDLGELEITPKHPEGDDMAAMLFREGNYAYKQVRTVARKSTVISDNLPIEYIQLVCE